MKRPFCLLLAWVALLAVSCATQISEGEIKKMQDEHQLVQAFYQSGGEGPAVWCIWIFDDGRAYFVSASLTRHMQRLSAVDLARIKTLLNSPDLHSQLRGLAFQCCDWEDLRIVLGTGNNATGYYTFERDGTLQVKAAEFIRLLDYILTKYFGSDYSGIKGYTLYK